MHVFRNQPIPKITIDFLQWTEICCFNFSCSLFIESATYVLIIPFRTLGKHTQIQSRMKRDVLIQPFKSISLYSLIKIMSFHFKSSCEVKCKNQSRNQTHYRVRVILFANVSVCWTKKIFIKVDIYTKAICKNYLTALIEKQSDFLYR